MYNLVIYILQLLLTQNKKVMKRAIYLFILFSITSCTQSNNRDGQTSNNQKSANEERMLEFYKVVMNGHNPALVDSFCTTDFIDHQPFAGYQGNITGLKNGMSDMITGFPDLNFNVDYIKSWGDTVIAKFRIKGTNSGPFMGTPATNKSIDVEGIDIVIIKNRKASEHWGYIEELKMMSQLGIGQTAGIDSVEKNHE